MIGRVIAPRGVRGELAVEITTDAPERFTRLQWVYLGAPGTGIQDELLRFEVEGARLHRGRALLQLGGIADRDAAERWRNARVYVPRTEALPLQEGEYYYHQIEGLSVITLEGEMLGRISGILATGANDVYVVAGERGELLLPAIKDVIVRVDLEAGTLWVRLLEGLR